MGLETSSPLTVLLFSSLTLGLVWRSLKTEAAISVFELCLWLWSWEQWRHQLGTNAYIIKRAFLNKLWGRTYRSCPGSANSLLNPSGKSASRNIIWIEVESKGICNASEKPPATSLQNSLWQDNFGSGEGYTNVVSWKASSKALSSLSSKESV